MIMTKTNTPGLIETANGLDIIGQLLREVWDLGGRHQPLVTIGTNGWYTITLIFDGEAPMSEITAWQLATGVWEVETRTYDGAKGQKRKARTTWVEYCGVRIELAIVTPAPADQP